MWQKWGPAGVRALKTYPVLALVVFGLAGCGGGGGTSLFSGGLSDPPGGPSFSDPPGPTLTFGSDPPSDPPPGNTAGPLDPAPEPSTIALIASGIAGLAIIRRRRPGGKID
jgi:hypothetical protein